MRYLMTFSYNGLYFNGYQKQKDKNLKTVQGIIEYFLTELDKDKVKIQASGRTDKGVHAINQKAHFDFNKNIDSYNIKKYLNKKLNKEIYIKDIVLVPDDFHARYNVVSKEYRYYINIGEFNPIEKDYVYQYNKKLNVKSMKKNLSLFQDTHDFQTFCKGKKDNTIRTIFKTNIKQKGDKIEIIIIGNGFLRSMVRNIVTILLEAEENKLTTKDIKDLINKKEYNIKTISSCGLYLWDVMYK